MCKMTGTFSKLLFIVALIFSVSSFALAQCPPPSGLNTFANPFDLGFLLTGSYNSIGSNMAADCYTDNYAGATNQAAPDVFYKITTGPCSDKVVVSTCSANTDFDTYIHFLNASGTEIGSNDNAAACGVGVPGSSELTMTGLLPNTVYYIVVEGAGAAEGTFDLTITETDDTPFTVAATAAPSVVCVGGNAVLNATPTGGMGAISYAWLGLAHGNTHTGIPYNITGAVIATDDDGYQVIATDVNGCTAEDFTFLTVNEQPTVVPSPDVSVCAMATSVQINAVLGGSATGATWSFSNPGGGTLSSTTWSGFGESYDIDGNDLTGPFPKNIVFTILTDAPAGCTAATGTVTLTITANPDLTATATPATICAGESAVLSSTDANSTTGTTTWYATQNDADTEINPISATVSPTVTTTYFVRKNVTTTGCFDIASVVVTVNPLPTITLGAVTNVCQGATSFNLPYTAVTNAPNEYSITAGAAALTGFTPVTLAALGGTPIVVTIPGASAAGTYDFNLTVKNTTTGCVSTVVSFTVTIQEIATATIAYAGSPFCKTTASGAVSLSGTGTFAGGTYSASPAGLTIDDAPAGTGLITPTTSTAGTYTVTYTIAASGSCPAVNTTTMVTITAQPAADVAYTSPVCTTAGAQLPSSFSVAGGLFSIDNGGTIDSGTGSVTNAAGSYTVTYTIAAAGGCAATSSTAALVITPLPTASISYTGTPFCQTTASGAVSLTGTGGFSGGAYSAAPSGLTIDAVTGEITPTSSTPGTYTVSYVTLVAGGCAAVTATTSVTINAAPLPAVAYASSPFCLSGGNQGPSSSSPVGGTFSIDGGGTIDAGTGVITIPTTTAGTYTVTYTIAAAGGCAATSSTASVTITTPLTATISYTGTPFCKTGTGAVTFTGTGTGGTYTGTAGLVINGSTGLIDLAASTTGAHTVTYTVLAINGCPDVVATANILINPLPTATIAYTAAAFCTATLPAAALTAPVTRTGTAGGNYTASPAGLTIDGTTGTLTFATSAAGVYTVTYTFTDAVTGCTNTATTLVTINAQPTPTITTAGGSFTTCAGTPLLLDAGVFTTYAWASGPTTQTLSVTQSVGGTQNYIVTVTDAAGCRASTSQVVTYIARPQASVSGTATICAGQSAIISATLTNGTTYTIIWSDGVTQTGVTSPATRTVSPLTSTTYTITSVIAVNTTCSATVPDISGSAAITVTAPGAAPTVNPTSITACVGQSYTITTTPAASVPVPVTITYGFSGDLTGSANASGVTPALMTSVGTISTTSTQGGACTAQATDFPVGATGTSYSQAGWSVGDYHEFTLNANTNYTLAISDFTFKIRRSSATTAPTALNVTKIVDGGAETAIGAASYALTGATGSFQTFTLTGLGITTALSGNVKIRVKVLTNATPNTCSTMRIDDVSFVGTTTLSPDIHYYSDAAHTTQVGTGLSYTGTATVGITDIYVRNESGACPSADAIVPITVNELPTLTLGTVASVCNSATSFSLPYSSPVGSPNQYSIAAVAPSALAGFVPVVDAALPASPISVTIPSGATAGTYNFNITVKNSVTNCTPTVIPFTLTIDNLVTAAIAYTGTPFCTTAPNPTPTFTGTATGGMYSGVGVTIDASTGVIDIAATGAGTFTINYDIAANGACPAVNATTSVTINAPIVPVLAYASPVCIAAGDQTPTTFTPTGGVFTIDNGGVIDGATGEITAAVANYIVTYTIAATGGCAATSSTAAVNIITTPSATIAYTGTPFCTTTPTATPTLTGTTGGAYSSTAGLNINASTGIVDVAGSTPGTYTVAYDIVAGTCPAVHATASITINAPIMPDVIYAASTCKATGNLSPTSFTPVGGSFGIDNSGSVNAATGVINIPPTAVGTYTVTYTIAATGGCAATSSTATVAINDAPALIATTPVAACVGSDVTLEVTLDVPLPTAPIYTWTSGPNLVGVFENTNDIFGVVAADAGSYVVEATNACGTSTATVVLTVNAVPEIASVTYDCGPTVTVVPLVAGTYTYTLISQIGGTPPTAFPFAQANNPAFTLGAGTSDADFTITANGCTSLLFGQSFASCNGGVLPVKLTYFKGTIVGKDNQLDWGTATEQNAEWFIVEGSNDGVSYKEVGRKRAAGNSSTPRIYAFTHTDVPTSMYYRLRMIDADGKFEVSNTVYLRRNKGSLAINNVFPNPTEGMITVQYEVEKPTQLRFTITDELGRRLSTKTVDAISGVNNQPLDLADFPGGVYFLLIDEADGKRTVRRVVKQ